LFGAGVQCVSLQTTGEPVRRCPNEGGGHTHVRGRVHGPGTYHLSLQLETKHAGGGLYQGGVLVATATSRSDGHSVPIKCRWKRRLGAHLIEIPGINNSMYHTSVDDIGADVVCVAEPVDDPSQGQSVGVLGPFMLDPISKMNLEKMLPSENHFFIVQHYLEEDDPDPRDLRIHITQDYVKVVHPGANGGSREAVAPYSAEYPKVVIDPLDPNKFRLELSKETDKIYNFAALCHQPRDDIALLIRCFHARKYVTTSFILSHLFQNPATPGAPLTNVQPDGFDIHALGERLGKELDRTVGQLEVVEKVVKNATNEKGELQAQLRETISSYTEAIEQLHDQLADARGGPAASLQLQLHEARAQQNSLQLDMQEVRHNIEQEQQRAPKTSETSAERAAQVEALTGEISQLKTSISALIGDRAMNSHRDLTHQE